MSGLVIEDTGTEPRQKFDTELAEGSVPEQDRSQQNETLRDIFSAIDPDEVAELRERNRKQADL